MQKLQYDDAEREIVEYAKKLFPNDEAGQFIFAMAVSAELMDSEEELAKVLENTKFEILGIKNPEHPDYGWWNGNRYAVKDGKIVSVMLCGEEGDFFWENFPLEENHPFFDDATIDKINSATVNQLRFET